MTSDLCRQQDYNAFVAELSRDVTSRMLLVSPAQFLTPTVHTLYVLLQHTY